MKQFITLSILALFIYSCEINNQDDTLDIALEEVLTSASPTGNLDYFELPASNDFDKIPQDPKNPLTKEKVALGKFLFHETGLALNPNQSDGLGTYSCASCHHAGAGFQAGVAQGIADGGIGFGVAGEGRVINPLYDPDSLDVQPIRSPTVLNSAYQKVMLWNGQFGAMAQNIGTEERWEEGTPIATNNMGYEGVETQAIAGLKVHRMDVNSSLIQNTDYKILFDLAFPNIPTSKRYTKEYVGLAIAAYERTILANQAPFQQFLKGNPEALSHSAKEGAILFFTKGKCNTCHTGPALNAEEFHALGMNDLVQPGTYGITPNDATKQGRGGFTGLEADMFKFKVPQLYSLQYSPHYGHGASFQSIKQVVRYKSNGVKENPNVPDMYISEHFSPLNLTETEIDLIVDFVENGLNDSNLKRYEPAILPTGNCFPNNDALSKSDLGCQ